MPLTAKKEKELLLKSLSGSLEARNILVERNLRLVAHVVKKYASQDSDKRSTEDLISVGTIGLIKAINSYNPDKSVRLSTYAAKCIENEILMLLRQDKKREKEISIFEPIGKDKEGNELNIIDVLGEEMPDSVEEMLARDRIKCIYDNIETCLTDRERYIIINRYGLCKRKAYTQNDLAKKLGISRSYVSRIEQRALDKLKNVLSKNGLS